MRKFFSQFIFSKFYKHFSDEIRTKQYRSIQATILHIPARTGSLPWLSYSSLAMHERGDGALATKALIKFGELLIACETAKKLAKASELLPAVRAQLDKQHDKAVKEIQYWIIDHRRRIHVLQHKLKAIQAKHEAIPAWLQIIDERVASLPKTAAAKADLQGLEEMHAKACDVLLKTKEQKLKMQLTIALLEAAADVYGVHLNGLKEGDGQ